MSTGKIYCITNLVTNKIYIGKTIKDLATRFREHITTAKRWLKEELENRPHPYQSRLYPSMNKYGYENFKIELIEELNISSGMILEQREQFWISYYNATDDKYGYNISPGGLGGPLFKGHKQSDLCKRVNSERNKGTVQSRAFVEKRSRARARLMQSLDTGKTFSILDLKTGYFYEQTLTTYRIYKSDGKFYACLESPHNRLPALSSSECTTLLQAIRDLANKRHNAAMHALHTCVHSQESIMRTAEKLHVRAQQGRAARLNLFLTEHNIDKDEYIRTYLQYKDNCPNRHLELIYNIPYSKVRTLNNFLNLHGGGSGHGHGKITIEEKN